MDNSEILRVIIPALIIFTIIINTIRFFVINEHCKLGTHFPWDAVQKIAFIVGIVIFPLSIFLLKIEARAYYRAKSILTKDTKGCHRYNENDKLVPCKWYN